VFLVGCVGNGLCDELIPGTVLPGVCVCLIVCGLETSKQGRLGCGATAKNITSKKDKGKGKVHPSKDHEGAEGE
jgi:hypothetical protein